MIEPIGDTIDKGTQLLADPLHAALAAGIAVALALGLHAGVFFLLRRVARLTDASADDIVVRYLHRPTRLAFVVLGLMAAARYVPELREIWSDIATFVLPAVVGWMALAIVRALVEAAKLKADISVADNLKARRKRTKLTMFSRIATFIIVFVTVGLMLLAIPGVRDIGVTLVASAGLAGLAVGAAAQPALKSLIAGIQMALTEPIRIGDMVKVEGTVGRVEEIRMTFVMVRVWDERVLVVPTGKFFEESFENWSRAADQLTGIVMLNLDPIANVPPIRQAFLAFVHDHPLWDKRDAAALVVEAFPESIALRLSMTAATIGDMWDLRCAVREFMLEWLRENQPEALIRHRLEVEAANERGSEG